MWIHYQKEELYVSLNRPRYINYIDDGHQEACLRVGM